MSSDYMQRRQNIKLGIEKPDGPKPPKALRKIGLKKQEQMRQEKEAGGDSALDQWYEARRKEMIGKCQFCNSKTEKDNDDTYRHSVAHLLPKKEGIGGFPSVATHPANWLELCFYGNSCHTNYDTHMISLEMLRDSVEWPLILEKFLKVYPYIRQEERSAIPDVFLPYLNQL